MPPYCAATVSRALKSRKKVCASSKMLSSRVETLKVCASPESVKVKLPPGRVPPGKSAAVALPGAVLHRT